MIHPGKTGRVDTERGHSGRVPALGILLLLALGACALALLWTLRETPTVGVPATPVAGGSVELESRTAEPEQFVGLREEAGGEAGATSGTSGFILLELADAASGAPLADFEYLALSEKGGGHLMAIGRTDPRGRTKIQVAPSELVLVQTPRKPPHASSLTAVRLASAGHQDVEVRVGSGGSVIGRVVDEIGQPVEGAELALHSNATWRDPARKDAFSPLGVPVAELVATTSPDGCFRIDHVVSMAKFVTELAVGEGGLEPELAITRWLPVTIQASKAGRSVDVSCQVCPGELVALPDIVLPRPSRWSGVVLNARGEPLAGTLVSGHASRARMTQANLHKVDPQAVKSGLLIAPGLAGFVLLPGECLTDAEGRFTLTTRAVRGRVLVWTAQGALQDFPLPDLAPAEEREGLELRVDDRCVLRFDLYGPDGRPALASLPTIGKQRIFPLHQPEQELWITWRALLRARLEGGLPMQSKASPTADGAFVFQLPCRPSQIESFEILVPGYAPLRQETLGALRSGGRASWTLEPLPRLLLQVELTGERRPEESDEPQRLVVRAFPVAPDPALGAFAPPPPDNSGPATYADLALDKDAQELDLPMASTEAHWLYLRTSRGSELNEFHAGPFQPSPAPSPGTAGPARSLLLVPRLPGGSPQRPQPTAPPPDAPNAGRGSLYLLPARRREPIDAATATTRALAAGTLLVEALEPWRAIELRLTGAAVALPEELEVELLQITDPRGYACGYQPDPPPKRPLRLVPIEPPDVQGAQQAQGLRRARTLARAGAWHVRLRSSTHRLEPETVLVRAVEELQVFELQVD